MKKTMGKQSKTARLNAVPEKLAMPSGFTGFQGSPRLRVYLDSTIPSVFCDQRATLKFEIEATRRWWKDESGKYEIWISPATIAEVDDGNHPHKKEIQAFCDKLPVLAPNFAVDELAQHYVQQTVMPRKHLGDAWHLAYATYHKFDFLLTWNCNHLANANKRRHLEIVNNRVGFATPQIVTPLELFSESEEL